MKLLFAIKRVTGKGGGAERVLSDIVNGLTERGHDITVLSFDTPGAASFFALHKGVREVRMGLSGEEGSTARLAVVRNLLAMRRTVLAGRYDGAVAFMHSSYVPMALALVGSGVPLVASEHAPRVHYDARPLQRRALDVVNGLIAVRAVPSEALKAEQPARFQDKTVVLHNPLPLDGFIRAGATAPAAPPMLLCLGKFRPEKGQGVLVDAFAQIADQFPNWRLRLPGDGPLFATVEAQIAKLGLTDKVELPGMVSDVAGEYARASLVAMPSDYEAAPMVAAEAMASARPLVAFADCLGARSLITDGTDGVLVDPGSDRAGALAAALAKLMADDELRGRLAANAPAAVARFAAPAVIGEWESVLANTVGGERGGRP